MIVIKKVKYYIQNYKKGYEFVQTEVSNTEAIFKVNLNQHENDIDYFL